MPQTVSSLRQARQILRSQRWLARSLLDFTSQFCTSCPSSKVSNDAIRNLVWICNFFVLLLCYFIWYCSYYMIPCNAVMYWFTYIIMCSSCCCLFVISIALYVPFRIVDCYLTLRWSHVVFFFCFLVQHYFNSWRCLSTLYLNMHSYPTWRCI